VCNVSERVGACLLWAFIACAAVDGLLLLILGIMLAVQSR
jgi:hypothetical protein